MRARLRFVLPIMETQDLGQFADWAKATNTPPLLANLEINLLWIERAVLDAWPMQASGRHHCIKRCKKNLLGIPPHFDAIVRDPLHIQELNLKAVLLLKIFLGNRR